MRHQPGIRTLSSRAVVQYNEVERRVWHKHLDALRNYRPPAYSGRVWFLRSPVHLFRGPFELDELDLGGPVEELLNGSQGTVVSPMTNQMQFFRLRR